VAFVMKTEDESHTQSTVARSLFVIDTMMRRINNN
jgi:hypothetical protein